jgi:hypothetical protein
MSVSRRPHEPTAGPRGPRARRRAGTALSLLLAGLAVAGCGELNRTVTLGNHETALQGAAVAAALRAHLAAQGSPAVPVACTQKVAVHIGVSTTCRLLGPAHETVVFKFRNAAGQIEAASVKRR